MESYTIALFGEAERGEFRFPYYFQSLPQLVDNLGNPPHDSLGLHLAVQALLFHRNLIFLRVKEEGFSTKDYLAGLKLLETHPLISKIAAICIPGVGEELILEAVAPLCRQYHHIIITTESDLYDYLTESG